MGYYDVHPNYNPNLLPQWQRSSKIEEEFLNLVQQLCEQETSALLCGSAYAEANNQFLHKKRKKFLKGTNQFMLRYRSPYEPDSCYEENMDSFAEMKKDLAGKFASTNLKRVMSLSWNIDYMAQNPYKALLSWQCAFRKYMNLNSKRILQQQTYYAFHMSTLYLLCTLIPHTHNDASFNPMQILSPLQQSFENESRAFLTLLDVYPPVDPYSTAEDVSIKDVIIYDYMIWVKSVWSAPSDFLERVEKPLYEIFKKHILKSHFALDIEFLEDFIRYIMEASTKSGTMYYLFPFICAKAFSQLFFNNESKDLRVMERALDSYETIDRLFNKHQRKVQSDSIFNCDESTHPVIAFMLDVVSLFYEFEMIDLKKLNGDETEYVKSEHRRAEYEIVNQINTNWLILYLYGNGRLFNNPCICSHFCELKLPVFLRDLFLDEEDSDDLELNPAWIYASANVNDEPDVEAKVLEKLYADCAQEFKKMPKSLVTEWKKQLAKYIFDPSMWEDNKLNVSSIKFQTQIDRINSLINEAYMLFGEKYRGKETPSMVIREIYICDLFAPILDDLEVYLNMSASLETHWKLFLQFTRNRRLIKECIDQRS